MADDTPTPAATADLDALLALARQLGEGVATHPTIKRYAEAQKALAEDAEASRLLQDFDRRVQVMMRNEQMGQPVTATEREAVESLQARLASNLKVKAFSIAQVDLTDLLRKVSQAWQRPVAEAQNAGSLPAGGGGSALGGVGLGGGTGGTGLDPDGGMRLVL